MKVYKIKDTNTGLFSLGGRGMRFNEKGKTWNTLGGLKNVLNYRHISWDSDYGTTPVTRYIVNKIPANLEVVVVEINESECEKFPASDLYPPTGVIKKAK